MARLTLSLLVALGVGLAGPNAWAKQDDPRLGPLFTKLKAPSSAAEAKLAEEFIWKIWAEHDDPALAKLMVQGLNALSAEEEELALADFTEIIRKDPTFAEAWNKRAIVQFQLGNYTASLADIEHVLTLEPRHFGAFQGLGQIYLILDRKGPAVKAFAQALAINPNLNSLKEIVEDLKLALAGNPI